MWTKQRQGPAECRYIIGAESENRFICQMDNEATDAEWALVESAPELLAALQNLMRETDDGTQLCAKKFSDAARAAIAKATGA